MYAESVNRNVGAEDSTVYAESVKSKCSNRFMCVRPNVIYSDIYNNTKLKIKVVIIHKTIPQKVGRANASKAHLKLPLYFFMLIKVVPQGKCNNVNIITLIPVSSVHPFCLKISPIAKVSSTLTRIPEER